jgi:hypothetical protein
MTPKVLFRAQCLASSVPAAGPVARVGPTCRRIRRIRRICVACAVMSVCFSFKSSLNAQFSVYVEL